MTVPQFRRALDTLQISSLGRLLLVEPEIAALIALYKDPDDPDRVCWRTFEDDIDRGAISYIIINTKLLMIYPGNKSFSCLNYRIFLFEEMLSLLDLTENIMRM